MLIFKILAEGVTYEAVFLDSTYGFVDCSLDYFERVLQNVEDDVKCEDGNEATWKNISLYYNVQ
jgi:hypothetical protein